MMVIERPTQSLAEKKTQADKVSEAAEAAEVSIVIWEISCLMSLNKH